MNRKEQGFTLIELMIVVAIIAIIAAIAVPNLLSARLAANESNAISTLRNLVSAQAQFQSTAAVDQDSDGTGEYGSIGELAGAVNLNVRGLGPAQLLDPPILGATFQQITANGEVTKSGYFFTIFLPDNAGAPLKEVATPGGPAAGVDADNCEIGWCAYAWPVDLGTTGNRAFFVNQRGEILQTKMDNTQYSGANAIQAADALGAFDDGGAGDMFDQPGLADAAGENAVDNNLWTPVQ